MIIKITLTTENLKFPKDYRPVFVSMIKNALSNSNKELYHKIYDKETPEIKNFCFSVKFTEPKFLKDYMLLGNNKILLEVSVPDRALEIDFYNAFLSIKEETLPLHNNSMKIERVYTKPYYEIKSDTVIVKMLSPLLLLKHKKGEKDKYITFDDAEFQKSFYEITRIELERIYGYELKENEIEIVPIKATKTVAPVFGLNVNCSLGIYILKANPIILNKLYQCGIGSKRGTGFGFFEILG